jgi:hypothetical protein
MGVTGEAGSGALPTTAISSVASDGRGAARNAFVAKIAYTLHSAGSFPTLDT